MKRMSTLMTAVAVLVCLPGIPLLAQHGHGGGGGMGVGQGHMGMGSPMGTHGQEGSPHGV